MKYYGWYAEPKENFIEKYEILEKGGKIKIYYANNEIKEVDYSEEREAEIIKAMKNQVVFAMKNEINPFDIAENWGEESSYYAKGAVFFIGLGIIYSGLVFLYRPDASSWILVTPIATTIISIYSLAKYTIAKSITEDILKNRYILRYSGQLPPAISLQTADEVPYEQIQRMTRNKKMVKSRLL